MLKKDPEGNFRAPQRLDLVMYDRLLLNRKEKRHYFMLVVMHTNGVMYLAH